CEPGSTDPRGPAPRDVRDGLGMAGGVAVIDTSMQGTIRALSSDELISSRGAYTDNVRVEVLRCGTDATVQWNVSRPEVALMWVRDKGSNAQITVAGRQADSIPTGRARFWFFPEGVDAKGELTGKSGYDCAGVFIDPRFLSSAAKQALVTP